MNEGFNSVMAKLDLIEQRLDEIEAPGNAVTPEFVIFWMLEVPVVAASLAIIVAAFR